MQNPNVRALQMAGMKILVESVFQALRIGRGTEIENVRRPDLPLIWGIVANCVGSGSGRNAFISMLDHPVPILRREASAGLCLVMCFFPTYFKSPIPTVVQFLGGEYPKIGHNLRLFLDLKGVQAES
jgi:hypothetical protein